MDRLDEYLYGSLKDEHRPKKTLNEKVLCVCAGELGLQNTGVKGRNKTGKSGAATGPGGLQQEA